MMVIQIVLRTYIEKEDDSYSSYLYDKEGIIIQDHKTRFQSMTNNRHRNDNITHTLLKWLKPRHCTQVFGFFVSTKMVMPLPSYRYVTEDNRVFTSYVERKEVLAKLESFQKSSLSQT